MIAQTHSQVNIKHVLFVPFGWERSCSSCWQMNLVLKLLLRILALVWQLSEDDCKVFIKLERYLAALTIPLSAKKKENSCEIFDFTC